MFFHNKDIVMVDYSKELREGIVYIFTNKNNAGNGVVVGNKLLTVAHVVTHSDNFSIDRNNSLLSKSAICFRETNYWYKSFFCRLSLLRYGWNYDDFALYEVNGYQSPFTLSPNLPLVDDILETYSLKEEVVRQSNNIFYNESHIVVHKDYARVLYIRGNFIFCEMNGMLEKGRSGCPLIKGNEVYGILRGGDDKKICWFQSTVSILKRLYGQGVSI